MKGKSADGELEREKETRRRSDRGIETKVKQQTSSTGITISCVLSFIF
jgi:hypothetical protein